MMEGRRRGFFLTMKALPKNLRTANRYVLLHVKEKMTVADFQRTLFEAFSRTMGVLDVAKANINIEVFAYPFAIVRTNAQYKDYCKAALVLNKLPMESIKTSGQLTVVKEEMRVIKCKL